MKSRRSYLEDEELADINVRGFVKLAVPKSDVHFTVKNPSERETANKSSVDSSASNTRTFGGSDLDQRAANLTTDADVSRHRTRRQSRIQKFLSPPRQITVTLFEKEVIGINMKVEITVHIKSIKEFYKITLDKTELDLILTKGPSLRVKLLADNTDTTKPGKKDKTPFDITVVSALIV